MPKLFGKKPASETARGIGQIGCQVRELLTHFTRRDMLESEVGLILYGYLAAALGPSRLWREWPVREGQRGRPPQVDFVVGRRRQNTGDWTPDAVIELAVARASAPSGLSPRTNKTELKKLMETKAKHHILLLIDLLDNHRASSLLDEYRDLPRLQGRPVKGKIRVVYVGVDGVKVRAIKRQEFDWS